MSKTSSLTLETVKKHFEHWRLNKKQEEKKIPEPLWLMVGQLMKRYETSKIVAQLKISTGQLRQKGLLTTPPKAIKTTFVELPSVVSFSEHQTTLSIERVDGVKWALKNPSNEQISLLFQCFVQQ